MTSVPILAGLFVVLALAVAGLTRLVLGWLRARQILDRPNDRSSHSIPTPRGGGLGVVPVLVGAWALWAGLGGAAPFGLPLLTWVVLAGAAALAALSWLDDLLTLPAAPRFVAQGVAVAAALVLLPGDALVFQGWLPLWADRLIAGLGWLWFINLYNFMDGIDGITGMQTTTIGSGLAVLVLIGSAPLAVLAPAVMLVAAALGFLVWNWHPAKVFLGDVGSVPLGFLIGFLLVVTAAHGGLVVALILPLYYLVDATWTLLARALRGEKPWQAHRSHFYQRAVRAGASHAQVSAAVGVVGVALIGCAVVAARVHAVLGLGAAVVLVGLTCGVLARRARPVG